METFGFFDKVDGRFEKHDIFDSSSEQLWPLAVSTYFNRLLFALTKRSHRIIVVDAHAMKVTFHSPEIYLMGQAPTTDTAISAMEFDRENGKLYVMMSSGGSSRLALPQARRSYPSQTCER